MYAWDVDTNEGPSEACCTICGEACLPASALHCVRCEAPYHVDCWHFVGACGIFGCGGTRAGRGDELTVPDPEAAPAVLHIDEDTRPSLVTTLRPLVFGWVRKMAVRAVDTPKTLAAGVMGGFLAMGGMLAFDHYFGAVYTGNPAAQGQVAAWTALSYGLLAPYLTPYQLDRPGWTGAAALGAFYLLFYHGPANDVGLVAALLAMILAAAGLSELLLGARTLPGRLLGPLGLPARMAVAFVAMLGTLVVFHPQNWVGGPPLIEVQYIELGAWSLLAVLAGQSALETGKAEMEKKKIAASKAPAPALPQGKG